MEDKERYALTPQNRDTEKEVLVRYHYLMKIGGTDMEHFGIIAKREDSSPQVRQPEIPTSSTEWKTSQTAKVDNLLKQFNSKVSRIPHVFRIVYEQKGEKELKIWILTEERNLELRDQIYDAQIEIMEEFSDFDCHFHVIPNPDKSFPNTQELYSK